GSATPRPRRWRRRPARADAACGPIRRRGRHGSGAGSAGGKAGVIRILLLKYRIDTPLLKTDRLLGYLTMDEFRARLCCKVCGRRDPHLWVTFYAPLK